MSLDLKKIDEILNSQLAKETADTINKLYGQEPPIPKGWVSIEEHLPSCYVEDFITKGYTDIKVRNVQGEEFDTCVSDSLIWYYSVKEAGAVEWFNN